MTILAKNLKVVRKELGCTQTMMADILKVGFRTFVRYEAGERDAPVAVLVKIARLGNISLEKFLTKSIGPNDIGPLSTINKEIKQQREIINNIDKSIEEIALMKSYIDSIIGTEKANNLNEDNVRYILANNLPSTAKDTQIFN